MHGVFDLVHEKSTLKGILVSVFTASIYFLLHFPHLSLVRCATGWGTLWWFPGSSGVRVWVWVWVWGGAILRHPAPPRKRKFITEYHGRNIMIAS